jgi:anti-sigma factor ChrR (cupin superfamily)
VENTRLAADSRGNRSRLIVLAELVKARDLSFAPFRPGIEAAWIYGEASEGASAAVLRYAPGARIPLHRHDGYEHILVLEGSQGDERGSYSAGSLVINEPGSEHSVSTESGCLVLVIWERRVHFVNGEK